MYATGVPDVDYLRRLGGALDAAMDYRGTTPRDLATNVGVSRDTIYRWMNGRTGMSATEAAAAAVALDAPGDLFLRPPESRERAMAMMAAWDAMREA